MGRIKTAQVKRTSERLMKEHSDKFKNDFSKNKTIVTEFLELNSKKLRNVIAGYVTRLVRRKEEEK